MLNALELLKNCKKISCKIFIVYFLYIKLDGCLLTNMNKAVLYTTFLLLWTSISHISRSVYDTPEMIFSIYKLPMENYSFFSKNFIYFQNGGKCFSLYNKNHCFKALKLRRSNRHDNQLAGENRFLRFNVGNMCLSRRSRPIFPVEFVLLYDNATKRVKIKLDRNFTFGFLKNNPL